MIRVPTEEEIERMRRSEPEDSSQGIDDDLSPPADLQKLENIIRNDFGHARAHQARREYLRSKAEFARNANALLTLAHAVFDDDVVKQIHRVLAKRLKNLPRPKAHRKTTKRS